SEQAASPAWPNSSTTATPERSMMIRPTPSERLRATETRNAGIVAAVRSPTGLMISATRTRVSDKNVLGTLMSLLGPPVDNNRSDGRERRKHQMRRSQRLYQVQRLILERRNVQ